MYNFNKVIGIGLPKTGTVSLSVALTNNNIPTVHFGNTECKDVATNVYRGIYRFDIFEKYIGITNAFEMVFPQVDKEYPNSKFIYTIRDKDEWLLCAEKHWERMVNNSDCLHMSIHHHLITFGTYLFNKDRFSFVYDTHMDMVTTYFKNRKNDLLTLDITKDKEYVDKVCAFLDIPIINNIPVHYNAG